MNASRPGQSRGGTGPAEDGALSPTITLTVVIAPGTSATAPFRATRTCHLHATRHQLSTVIQCPSNGHGMSGCTARMRTWMSYRTPGRHTRQCRPGSSRLERSSSPAALVQSDHSFRSATRSCRLPTFAAWHGRTLAGCGCVVPAGWQGETARPWTTPCSGRRSPVMGATPPATSRRATREPEGTSRPHIWHVRGMPSLP